jgi:hypothetical protein
VSEKYEISSFKTPIMMENLKTMDLKNQNDPVLNMNPSFYSSKMAPTAVKKEPFSHESAAGLRARDMENSRKGLVPGLVMHSEISHPMGFHGETSLNSTKSYQTQFGKVPDKENVRPGLKFNGFYSKEAVTL